MASEEIREEALKAVPLPGDDAYTLAYTALDLLDTFRSLTDTERDRVWNAAQDAKDRETDPAKARRFSVLEAFDTFARSRDGDKAQVCFELDLTPEQYDRYEEAWQTVLGIHDAVNHYCERVYGGHRPWQIR